MFQSQEDVPGFPETITNDSCHCSHVHPSSTHTILLSRPSRSCFVARPHKSKQHLDSLRRKDSLRGAETTEISVRLENYFASHFDCSASRPIHLGHTGH